jgi:hypothetical protein
MPGSQRLLSLATCCCAAVLTLSAGAAEKKAAPPNPPGPCDVYGPDYKPVGSTGTCIKISGSVEFGVGISAAGGRPSAATSTDWIRSKPSKNGN